MQTYIRSPHAKRQNEEKIIAFMRRNPQGVRIRLMTEALGIGHPTIYKILHRLPDVFECIEEEGPRGARWRLKAR